jgi:hypothetical protein
VLDQLVTRLAQFVQSEKKAAKMDPAFSALQELLLIET